MLREIVLPETKPETEWILGRAVQKVAPTRKHALLQLAFARALDDWSAGRGQVATEWRFRASPPGEEVRPLVPDVAYLSFDRLRPLQGQDREVPPIAPEIVVEILSPGDRAAHVAEKGRVYRAWGVRLVLMVDFVARSLDAYDGDGVRRSYSETDTFTSDTFPGLRLQLGTLFAKLDIPD